MTLFLTCRCISFLLSAFIVFTMGESNPLVYYCSQEDQANATELYSLRRRLAIDRPTRIHCTIYLGGTASSAP